MSLVTETASTLNAARDGRLGIGIVGLGRLWEARHKPALARMSRRFRIAAVYDQVARRATAEAAQLGCVAAPGVAALVERADVDAVYLLSPQWFGLHPAGLARVRNKPVYCALPLAGDPAGLAELASCGAGGPPFMPELARRFYPATLRLRELLATTLGPPRLILGHARFSGFDRYAEPGPATQLTPLPLTIDPGANLLDWCRFVFQAEPTGLLSSATTILPEAEAAEGFTGPDFEGFVADFPGGAQARIDYGRYYAPAWGEASRFLPRPGLQVFAERGAAWLELPDRIQWTDATGPHEEHLPAEPSIGEILNDQFHRLVTGEPSLAPTLADALAVARLVDDLGLSRREGRRVALGA